MRARGSAWHRVISASGALRDNNRTWEPISIITRKENGPVSARLPDGLRTGRGCRLAPSRGFVSLSLSNGTERTPLDSAQSQMRHRPVRWRRSLRTWLRRFSRYFYVYKIAMSVTVLNFDLRSFYLRS